MSEWASTRLDALAAAITSGATPRSGDTRYYAPDAPFKFAKIDDLTAAPGATLSETKLRVREAALRETALKLYPEGTILLSMYGTVGLVKITDSPMTANQALAALIPPFRCDPRFLYHLLNWARPSWERFKAQTTQANINGAIVKSREFPIPPRVEQHKIAETLDALDAQIRASEVVGGKLRSILTGLIDEKVLHGEPNSGGAVVGTTLGQACILVKDGTHLPPARVSRGVRLLSVRNIADGRFATRDDDTHVPWSFYRAMHSSWKPEASDVLLAIVGATIGKSAQVPASMEPFTFQRSLAILRAAPGQMLNDFLALIVRSSYFQAELWRRANQTAQPGVYLEQLGRIPIRLPSVDVQARLVAQAEALSARIEAEQRIQKNLTLIRQGVMDDLLSGRVRVPSGSTP